MLNDALQLVVREAGGEAILLDARRGRALIADYSELMTVLKNLRHAGFERLIDFTAVHLGRGKHGCEEFNLLLTLRIPEHDHAALILKWRYPDIAPVVTTKPAAETEPQVQPAAPDAPQAPVVDPALAALGVSAHAIGAKPGEPPVPSAGSTAKAIEKTAEIPQVNPDDIKPHPSLSHIWPAAGLCEREIWEMLGIAFSGHDNLKPLLLDEQFPGHPLRRGYQSPAADDYAADLLKERTEQGMVDAVKNWEQCSPTGTGTVKTDIECDVETVPESSIGAGLHNGQPADGGGAE